MSVYQKLYKLSLALSIIIFLNILFGPLVRATNSGLACPDWPLCFGKVVPPPEFTIYMEVGHRIYSALLSVLLLYTVVFIFVKSELRKYFGILGFLSILVIIIQITLGALTVTKLLDPTTVNLHLLNAVLLLTIIVTITVKAKFMRDNKEFMPGFFSNWFQNKVYWLLGLSVLFVYFQLYMGGRVSSHYAGLVCPDWPTCNGVWFPPMKGPVGYQMEHRFVAYFILVLVLVNYFIVKPVAKAKNPQLLFFLKMSSILVILQVLIGITNVLLKLPVLLTALHSGMGVALFISVYLSAVYSLYQTKQRNL